MSQLSINASSRLQPATAPLATGTQAPPPSPSFTDVFASSFNDTITASINRGLLDDPSTFDPNYRLTDAELTRMSVGVDPAMLEDLYSEAQSVRSAREADALRSKFLTATENRRTIAQAGIPGLVVYGGTQIFDPPTVIASLASGGLAQAGNAAKLSKIAMAGRMALIDASAQAGLETIRAIENPNFDAGDVASGAVSGVFTQLGIGLRGPSILSGVAGGAIGASAGTFIGESVFNDDATLAQIGTSSLIAAVMGGTFGAAAGPNTLDNAVVRESHAFAKQVDTEALADAIVTQPLTEKGRRVVKQAQQTRQERVAQMRNAAFDDDNPDAFMYPDAPAPPRDAARTDVPPSDNMIRSAATTSTANPAPVEVAKPSYKFAYNTSPDSIRSRNFYHGTGTVGLTPDTVDPTITSHEGLYGPGFYLTDNPSIADGYAKARGKKTGQQQVYQANIDNANLLDLEAKTGRQVFDAAISAFRRWDDLEKWLREAIPNADEMTGAEVYRILRQEVTTHSRQNEIPTGEYIENFSMLNENLYAQGFDGFTHVGGKNTGNDPHQVVILFDPARNLFDNPDNKPPLIRELNPVRRPQESQATAPAAPSQPSSQPAPAPSVPATAGGNAPPRGTSAQTAAADEPPRPPKTALDLDLSDTTDAATSSGFTGVRFGMLYRAGRSEIAENRRLANMLGRDILRKTDGTETLTSASQWVQRSHAAAYVAVQDAVDEAVAAVRRADPSRSRVDVERAITAGIEGSGPVTPEIANAVTAGRKLFEDLLATMHRHGVPGAGKTKADPFYVPHAALRSRIDELVNRITDAGGNGKAEMIEWVQETLRSGFDGITRKDGSPMPNDNKLKAYATAWVENAGRRGPMRQLGNVAKSRQEMVDEFIRRYQGVFGELDEADQDRIADIFDAMQGGEDEARFTRLRNALPLDMSARHTFSDGTTISMADLHERNFLALAASYSRRAHGHAAIAAVAEAMGRPGASADDLLASAAARQRNFESANPDRSLGAKWRNQRERDNIARLDALLRSVTGAPIREETTASNLAAALRSYNFVNLLSTPLAAINNSAEVVASLRVSGIRASLKTGGKALERTWYKIMRDARAGTLGKAQHDAIARLGIAQDFAASRILERSVPGDVPASELRRVMQRIQRASYIVSGQQFVEEQGRAFTAISLMQRLSDLADSGVSDAHLRSIGFTRQQWDRIAGQIRKHRTMESGIFGDTLGAFNVDSWDEGFSQDASRLLNAIAKQSSMLVLQPSTEQMDLWMTGEAGKILLQLRSYMIAANDVLLRGGQDIKDPRAGLLGLMLAGSFASAMAYTQREYINSLFQDDPQKYRDERLTLNNIALQGWGRTAFSTYLPFVIDTSLQVSGNKPVFAQGRVSQIGKAPGISGALTSNPTSSTIDTAGRAIVGAGRAALLERERFTQPDANYWLRLMPNAFFVRDALRQFTKDLPNDDTPDF